MLCLVSVLFYCCRCIFNSLRFHEYFSALVNVNWSPSDIIRSHLIDNAQMNLLPVLFIVFKAPSFTVDC